ncbi:hypothetical protein DV737_g1433, partial [Chaetothyriales sp. CBS 132003]
MGIMPSGPAVPGPSTGILRTADPTSALAVAPEAPHSKAKVEGLDEEWEKIAYLPFPSAECGYKPGHEACIVHRMRAADDADVEIMAMTKAMTVDWSGMHMQGKAQIPKAADIAANAKSGRGTLGQDASASSALVSRGSDKATSVMIDDKIEQLIMGASDQELAELAKSFDDARDFPEWYKALPEAQREMFDKKPEAKGDKKGDGQTQKEKHDKGVKNSSSLLTINTVLKMGALAMFCMAAL